MEAVRRNLSHARQDFGIDLTPPPQSTKDISDAMPDPPSMT